jgi:hypothetical protein
VVLLREAVNAAEHGGGGSCRAAWVVPSGKMTSTGGWGFRVAADELLHSCWPE